MIRLICILFLAFFTVFSLPVAAEVTGPTFHCESYRDDTLKSSDEPTFWDDIVMEHPQSSYVAFNKDKTLMYIISVTNPKPYLEQHNAIYRVGASNELLTFARYAKFSPTDAVMYFTAKFGDDGNLSELEIDVVSDTRIQRTEFKCKFSREPFL